MSFCTDLPIIDIAILSTLRRFEGSLEVEGWLKTGNKGHLSRAWLSLKLLATFLVVLLIRDKAECFLIKLVTMRKLLISAAKMTKLWLGIVQHLVRWPPFFISLLQSACLREHLYKIWEKSIWYFYHARAIKLLLTLLSWQKWRLNVISIKLSSVSCRLSCRHFNILQRQTSKESDQSEEINARQQASQPIWNKKHRQRSRLIPGRDFPIVYTLL